ncbi:MAG: EscF/YscF/HrpA family type III secretion system needle major subunit [Pseudomonadota bacterium]
MSNFSSAPDNFTLESIYDNLLPKMKKSEGEIRSLLNTMGSTEMTSQDLILTQAKLQEWTLKGQLSSTLIKEISDTLKSIVQKAG